MFFYHYCHLFFWNLVKLDFNKIYYTMIFLEMTVCKIIYFKQFKRHPNIKLRNLLHNSYPFNIKPDIICSQSIK